MTKSLYCTGRWRREIRLLTRGGLVVLCAGFCRAMATGYDGPSQYLSNGSALTVTPEFYWELEAERLAKDFHPTEKPALAPRSLSGQDGKMDTGPMQDATEKADAADFADAIKTGRIKPPDATAAQQQHAAARTAVMKATETASGELPAEFACEFADYDRGAFAFRQGKKHWDEARTAWLALLNRPAANRHYRTIWAAFMLGKLGLKNGDPDAVKWFQKTREYAGQGFGDSLGMAADSYGWEGRSEWLQGHPAKAAPMFLTQLALGDLSAVVSLKALIPDRDSVDGMLNYDSPNSSGTGASSSDPNLQALAEMAADPLLRRLETAHILATESGGEMWNNDGQSVPQTRSARWLTVIKAAGLQKVEDAEYLGWLAYTTGDYKGAQHWLDLSAADSPAANWLRSRLELRAGKTMAAAQSMAAAWRGIVNAQTYTGWKAAQPDGDSSVYIYGHEDFGSAFTMSEWASGDMGALRLLRTDFVQAMDTFLKGGLREDAAYVAEHVLTIDELKAYVDRMPPPKPIQQPSDSFIVTDNDTDPTAWMRYLLGRRLVREDRYDEAAPYLPTSYGKLLAKYAAALKRATNPNLPKQDRADAWSTAAWVARFDGMELMGTEADPDGFDSEGAFPDADVAQIRLSGTYPSYKDGDPITLPVAYSPARAEVARLRHDPVKPDVRFHYRVIAAALAMKAAALMPGNTEELADAVNSAGNWVKDSSDKTANRYYDVIEKRCANTKIGRDVIGHHWFVDDPGPWSTALQKQDDSLHKDCGIQAPQD